MDLLNNFWDIFVWFLWGYIFIAYLFALVLVLGDIFRDRSLNGWVKAVWIIFLIFVPFLTVLVYVIARGKGMSDRNTSGAASVPEDDDYRPRIIPPASPSDEIAKAQGLLAAGSITEDEFAALKARVLT